MNNINVIDDSIYKRRRTVRRRRLSRLFVGYGTMTLLLLVCVGLLVGAMLHHVRGRAAQTPDGKPSASTVAPQVPETVAPSGPTVPEPTTPEPTVQEPVTPEPTVQEPITPEPTVQEPATPEPSVTPQVYELGTPLPEGEAVEDSRFDDAVFLGDSRTEGLQLFSGLSHGTFYWHRGITVFEADDAGHKYFNVNGVDTTLLGALRARSFGSVYIMLGINELGYSPSAFENGLSGLLDSIMELQPQAVIYLQTLPPVNDAKARGYGVASYINSENVDSFNEVIARVALNKRVVLLDTAQVYRGPDGQLPAELTGDGVHFTSGGYTRWADFLRTHTIDPGEYFRLRASEG